MPCCTHEGPARTDPRYRRIVRTSLVINGGMFLIEIIAGLIAGSVSLQADALDFLGDVANYGISLFVIGKALRYRATAALIKGVTMGLFGIWVLAATALHVFQQTVPQAITMGKIGFAALVANLAVFVLLWAYRTGYSNMRSVWLCSRNWKLGCSISRTRGLRHRYGLARLHRCGIDVFSGAARRSTDHSACSCGTSLGS